MNGAIRRGLENDRSSCNSSCEEHTRQAEQHHHTETRAGQETKGNAVAGEKKKKPLISKEGFLETATV